MKGVTYITDESGERIALQIDLKVKEKITIEYLEEIEDIIAVELLKNDDVVDYRSSVEEIIKAKNV